MMLPAAAARNRTYAAGVVEDVDKAVGAVVDVEQTVDGCTLLGVGAVDVLRGVVGGIGQNPLAFKYQIEGHRRGGGGRIETTAVNTVAGCQDFKGD